MVVEGMGSMKEQEFYRAVTPLEAALIEEMERTPTVDCHEHLPAEQERLGYYVDAFTLFAHYCTADFQAAGMRYEDMRQVIPELDRAWRPQKTMRERWEMFAPYYEQVRYTGYARAAHIAMKKFYGEEELTEKNLEQVSERVQRNNTPGLYQRVLRGACNLATCINQGCPSDGDLMTSVNWLPPVPRDAEGLREWTGGNADFDAFVAGIAEKVALSKRQGYVGVKIFVAPLSGEKPSYSAARVYYEKMQAGAPEAGARINPLVDYLFDQIAQNAAKEGMVFCLHTGYWGDFRELNPSYLLPLVERNPETKFDVYHLGYPYVREAIMLGKAHHNVWINLCWTYIISQHFAEEGLAELLEMVPVNKILGFGGDYRVVEKVFGHLIMARESVARVLARKIEERTLRQSDAVKIIHRLFCENPKELYGIK